MADLLPRLAPVASAPAWSRGLAIRRPIDWAARLADPALAGLAMILTAAAQPHLFAAETLVSLDTATQYYPWYAYLGQSLRAGHVPGWNPATFSGTPFAANPLSGWTYVPAMLLFALLPLTQAVRLYLLLHPLLAAGGAYTLARLLGLGRAGALLAGVAYANTSFLQVQNVRSNPFASVYAWLPFALIGTELAIRASRWHTRCAWWGLAAIAMSQIVAVWPGQGAYYSAMLVGGYIAYRTLFVRPDRARGGLVLRARDLLVHAAAVFVWAAALDAAGILPRLEFNGLSNLAGGYTGAEAKVGGLNPREWLLVAVPGYWYAGASVLGLAIAAPFVDRARLPATIRYFGITSLGALLITGTVETPLHWLLYHLLPGFASLHPHAPERIMTVAYLGPALLAGAALCALQARGWRLGARQLGARARAFGPGLAVLLVVADLAAGGAKGRGDVLLTDPINGADRLTPVDLAAYFQPNGAARYLEQAFAASPGRYIGYAPYLDGKAWPYTTRFMDPATAALDVDNRALPFGLQDAQGYDASHLQRYDAYLAELNGRTQNYHDAEVFLVGLYSPLLDVLNVRYLIVPPANRLDASDTAALTRFGKTVYSDAQVRILENPSALPRAWIVHAASQATASDALAAIDSGRVQARTTALLEETPPPVAAPLDPAADRAVVTADEPDRMTVSTSTTAPGLLVFSEVYYPAWHAYVDQQPVHLYVADAALRAVPVPAGDHTVELRFESAALRVGCAISAAASLLLATLVLVGVLLERRSDRRRRARV
jgi:hypothetical protein